MKVLLTGGGTMGSVTPLLAVAEELEKEGQKIQEEVEFFWIGSWNGPEREFIEERGIKFYRITSGKLRRYFTLQNIWTIFFVIHGFFQSIKKILEFRPDVIISAGSFIAVPVIWAGWLLRVPALIHQQDYRPGLANRLVAPLAQKITVTFEKSLKDFSRTKVIWTGNPVRGELLQGDKERARETFRLEKDLPVVLVLGGGTGALKLNQLLSEAAPELTKFCQIINVTGVGRNICDSSKRFYVFQMLIHELKDALAVADIVVSRCGLGTLSELSVLKKPAILIPMPNTHQEGNVKPFLENQAAIVLNQNELTPKSLVQNIKILLFNPEKQQKLSERIKGVIKSDAAKRISEIIFAISKKEKLPPD